ncbi:putative phosphonate metabolism protein [Hoeflea marina]|uniref:Putative phosphonate metabolism protein n=1 Tax=Hoeflea marina TaxID=274592 RepID=A0A317PFZ3_9HYPH|nr:DUF1045 domain-containing protein [Hoeflea marina]PWV98876.1 putative phosphonate metabolism protein [Hoeflea marina]
MRYAIYFSPERSTPLAMLAASWIGRDAATGRPVPQPELTGLGGDELAEITGPARRYGFHGTLKAPFHLAEGVGERDLVESMVAFCADRQRFDLTGLRVGEIAGFLALLPDGANPELDALANDVVTAFDALRAPLSEREIERRNPERLTLAELRNLMRWGYPHVFDCFRFHMTLTSHLPEDDRGRVLRAAMQHFLPVTGKPVAFDALTLFVEPEPGAPFEIHSRVPLAIGQQRKTA